MTSSGMDCPSPCPLSRGERDISGRNPLPQWGKGRVRGTCPWCPEYSWALRLLSRALCGPSLGHRGALAARVPARHLLARGEPHAAEAAHEGHEVRQERDPLRAPAHEGMAGQDEAAILGVHRGELLAPHLQHPARVGDGVGGAVHVAEERGVVHQPLHGDFDERPVLAVDLVGDVVPHERGVVEKAATLENARGPDIHVPRRRAIAGGLHAELVAQDGELLLHDPLFLRGIEEAHGLVDVAVGADLVSRVADPLGGGKVVLDRPAGNEEAGAELQLVEEGQDTIDAYSRPEAALLEIAQAALGLLRLAEEKSRFRVEVEGQYHRELLPVRPSISHAGLLAEGERRILPGGWPPNPDTPPPLGWRI